MRVRYGISLIALALGAAACGGAGAKTAASSPTPSPSARGRGRGGAGLTGSVSAVNGSTITVNLRAGGSATIDTSSSTVVMKTVTTTVSALTPNTAVLVTGPQNADGTYTANAITITPAGGGGFGGGGGGFFGGGGGGGTFSPRPRPSGSFPGGAGRGGAGAANRAIGTITSVKGADVYLQTAAGATVEAVTSPSTVVSQTQIGSLADVTPGTTITVVGAQASTGAYDATRIIIGNLGFGGGGGFPGGGGFGGGGGGGTSGGVGA